MSHHVLSCRFSWEVHKVCRPQDALSGTPAVLTDTCWLFHSPQANTVHEIRQNSTSFPIYYLLIIHFLARLQNCKKRLLASCLSVRPPVRMEQLGSHRTDFHKILYLSFFFRKYAKKIKVLLKPGKNTGYFTRRRHHIYDNSSLNSS